MDDLLELIARTIDLPDDIDPATPLLSAGYVDSFDVVALVAAIEQRYAVEIPSEDIDVDRFDTPADILARIETARR